MGGLYCWWGMGRVGFATQAVCRCWWLELRTWRGQSAVLYLDNEPLFHEGEKYRGWPSIISWLYLFNAVYVLRAYMTIHKYDPLPRKGVGACCVMKCRGPFSYYFEAPSHSFTIFPPSILRNGNSCCPVALCGETSFGILKQCQSYGRALLLVGDGEGGIRNPSCVQVLVSGAEDLARTVCSTLPG